MDLDKQLPTEKLSNSQGESSQLAAIAEQLARLNAQVATVQQQLDTLPELTDTVQQIEGTLALVSDVYRYKPLQQHLEAGNWWDADLATIQLIVEIAGAVDIEELTPNSIRHIPCNALQTIDRLWRDASDGRFGFSVQIQLYVEEGGSLNTTVEQNSEVIAAWGDRLGWREGNRWRKCSELDFSLDAPVGCHPSQWWNSPYGSKMTNFFLARLLTCSL
ncbi:MAG: GUN4 domain-containing protein [Synechococcus sp.]